VSRGSRRGRAAVLVATVAALLMTPACGTSDQAGDAATTTMAALATSVDGLEGGTIALSEPDTTTVVAFVASWCAPCRRELPELERLSTELGDGARFLAVAVQEEPEQTRALVSETGITFEVGSDPDGIVLGDYGFTGLPGTLLLDGDGEVVHRYRGTIDFDDLERRLGAAGSD